MLSNRESEVSSIGIRANIYRLFHSLFNIKPNEFRLVQLFFLYITLICAAYTVISTAAITLFLSKTSEATLRQLLPWLYISIAISLTLVTGFYQKLIDRFSRIKLITWTTLFFIFSFLLFGFLVSVLGHKVWLYFLLMIWDDTCSIVLLMVFYSYLGDYFLTSDARRLYGYITGGMALGAPIGGFGSALLIPHIRVIDLLLIASVLLAIGNLIAFIIWKIAIVPKSITMKPHKANPILLRKILSNKFVLVIFAISGIATIAVCVGIYQLFVIASQTLDEKALGSFMGQLFGYIGIAQLVINFMMAGWLFQQIGVVKNLFIQPILLLFLSASFIFYPILLFAAGIKFVSSTFSGTLNLLGTQILLLPLPERIRLHTQSLLVGLIKPASCLIAGVLLIIFSFFTVPIQYYSIVILVLSVIWIVATAFLFPLYKKTLGETLNQINLDPNDLPILLNSADSKAVLISIFKTNDVEKIIVLLRALPMSMLKKLKPEIIKLLNHPNEYIMAEAIYIIGECNSKKDVKLIESYVFDRSELVKIAAIEAYARLQKADALPLIEEHFNSYEPTIMEASLVSAYRYGDSVAKRKVIARVKELMTSNPAFAAELMRKIIDPAFESDLEALLTDSHEAVRKEAIQAAALYPNSPIIKKLIDCLGKEDGLTPFVERAFFALPQSAANEIETIFLNANLKEMHRYILLLTIGKLGSPNALKIILDVIANNRSVILLVGACHALESLSKGKQLNSANLDEVARTQEDIFNRLRILRHAYKEMGAVPEDLRQLFADAIQFYIKILLILLSIRYRISELTNVAKIVSQPNKQFISISLELLETVLPKNTFSKVTTVLFPAADAIPFEADFPSSDTLKELITVDPWIHSLTLYLIKTNPSSTKMVGDLFMMNEDNRYFDYIDTITFLKKIDLFKAIPANYLLNIAEVVHKESFYAGECIVKEGEVGKSLFIIRTGRIDIQHKQQHITELGPGECIGELSLLDQLPASASAFALDEVQVLRLDFQDFNKVLETYPEVTESLLKILVGRLRKTTMELIQDKSRDVAA